MPYLNKKTTTFSQKYLSKYQLSFSIAFFAEFVFVYLFYAIHM